MHLGIAMAVAATAAAILLIAAIFFYLFNKFARSRNHRRRRVAASFRREARVNQEDLKKAGGNMKGLVVEENGIDILYMMETEGMGRQFKARFPNRIFNPSFEDSEEEDEEEKEEEKRIDVMVQSSIHCETEEVPLLCESAGPGLLDHLELVKSAPQLSQQPSSMIVEKKTQPLPPPPPPPPLPPSPPRKEIPKAPPLPSSPVRNREGATSIPKASGFISSLKPPKPPEGKANAENDSEAAVGEGSRKKGAGQTRLKPLHWDKVVANIDHSTVWDQINDGSFRFDDELIETLFGYSTNNLTTSAKANSNSHAQLFLLEPRKSQNAAILLRSLAVSRKEIVEALLDGQGLGAETLERLTKIAPTQEEESRIIQFSGNPDKLADADSFLYYTLKEVPTAFVRLQAMLFKLNYNCEIIQLKEHLQTVETGCEEMRTSGLFLKFLEAILRAGNRMNAGTSRGNAQGFNLSALRKLSDVKSIDGKTSLLHFIVEQVVQSEGKQHAVNQKHNLLRSNGEISNTTSEPYSDSLMKNEAEKEYLMLGLPVLRGLRDEFSEVKKAAGIDHQSFISMFCSLDARVTEIQQIITCCSDSERGGFVKEMTGFLEECEEGIKAVKEDQMRIMELVRKTNEYYLGGGSKGSMSNPFELFIIVKDFVDMVDEVCTDLKKKLEKKNVGGETVLSTPPLSPSKGASPLRFTNFDLHFLSSISAARSSSLSNDDF